jgi:sulfonate transport system ATP-binding protein
LHDASELDVPTPIDRNRQTTVADEAQRAVRARGLTRRFGTRAVLDGLDLDVAPGEFVALLGRSGSGKTTLLRALGRLDRISEGHLETPAAVATVFQEPRLLPWKRAWQNIALGLRAPDARRRALDALNEVGLAEHAQAWPATLSGGQAQRVSLARALVRDPKLLLLDEPFGALDALTRMSMHKLVQKLWRTHRPAVLLVTHDVDEAALLADRVLVLSQGRIEHEERIVLPAVRSVDQPEFRALRRRLLTSLGVEVADEAIAVAPARLAPGALR